jgi:hypothetical protein
VATREIEWCLQVFKELSAFTGKGGVPIVPLLSAITVPARGRCWVEGQPLQFESRLLRLSKHC